MTRALSFLVGHLRACWHLLRDHTITERTLAGRVTAIYCDECHRFLWVRR